MAFFLLILVIFILPEWYEGCRELYSVASHEAWAIVATLLIFTSFLRQRRPKVGSASSAGRYKSPEMSKTEKIQIPGRGKYKSL
jgi:hypothetical protein